MNVAMKFDCSKGVVEYLDGHVLHFENLQMVGNPTLC